MKKILSLIAVLSIILSGVSIPSANASENEYAITSDLNGGWTNEYIDRELILDAKLGTSPVIAGGAVEIGDDKTAVTVSRILGREGWVLSPDLGVNARYLNVNVDEELACDIQDGTSFAVEVDYYDKGKSSMALEYPCMEHVPLEGKRKTSELSQPKLNEALKTAEEEYLVFNDTGVWKTYTWFLDNPTMNDSLNGYDLRVGIYSASMGYSRDGEVVVSAVRVYRLKTASRLKIESDTSLHFGNIFYKGEEIELLTSFSSEIYPVENRVDYTLDTVYTVRNEDGEIVWTGIDSFTLPALSKVIRKQKFKADKFGIYRVDVECYSKDKKVYSRLGTEFSYVNSDKGKTVNPKAGVQIALANVKDTEIARLARNAGFAHARMMCYYYNWRKSAENYEINNVSMPGAFQSLFRAFKEAGLTINANLHSASWMGAAYKFSPIERTPPYTEDGLRRWADYVRQMAELLGDTVDCIEIWNEYNLGPNHSFNMENRPSSDYGKMYEISKKAIKEVNPDMPVVAMNTSGVARDWAEGVFKSGVTDIDVYACHPYQWYGDPIKYDSLANIENGHKLMEEYGIGDRPMWVGEYGYSSHYEDVNTDTEQGNYNAQSYALIMGQGYIDRFYFYCLLDKANPIRTDRESNFGLVRCEMEDPRPYMLPYAAKPGYLILSNMNMLYHDAEFIENINYSDTSRIVRSKSKSRGKELAMLFSNKDEGEMMTLNLGTDKLTLIDSYGNAEEITGSGGVFSFNVGKEIQYIEGNFKRFDADSVKVSPETANVDAVYGEAAKIKIINKAGKTIYAKAEPLEGSEAETNQCEIPKNGGIITVKGGNAVRGIERVKLTLYDNNKTYYCGNINLMYKNTVTLTTTLIPLESGWSMRCILKNLSDTKENSGRLTLLTPVEWKPKVKDNSITLEPGEEKTLDLMLPVGTSADDEVIEIGFVTDEKTGAGDYVSRNYNFSAAIHADTPVVIDGNGDEWTEGFINLNRNDQFHSLISLGSSYMGAEDVSAKTAIKWDDDNLYFYADVLDNKHFSTGVAPVNVWQMDSIQLGIVYDPESALNRSDFEEIAIGEIDGKNIIYRHKTRFKGDEDYTKVPGAELAVKVDGLHTYYELKIPWSSLMAEKVKIEPGTELKFAMVINENDGVGRVGYLALGDGIVSTKNSSLFKRLYIRN